MFLKAVPEKQILNLLSWSIVGFPQGTLSWMGHDSFACPSKPDSEGIFGGRSHTVGSPKPLALGRSPQTAPGDAGGLSPWHSQGEWLRPPCGLVICRGHLWEPQPCPTLALLSFPHRQTASPYSDTWNIWGRLISS